MNIEAAEATIAPSLAFNDVGCAVAFYEAAFGDDREFGREFDAESRA